MKSSLAFIICTLASLLLPNLLQIGKLSTAQSVIASSGGYYTSANASLSFTIGETVTATFQNGNYILTQGFQQPFKLQLNLKAFIQGFYAGSGNMENVLYHEGITAAPGNECDTITVQLRQSASPYNLVYESKHLLKTNGTIDVSGSIPTGQPYYIVLKHRNALETWSANPVTINTSTSYDFTIAANQAYGSNQIEMAPNTWALYSGDIVQDENMDLLDLGELETAINNFSFGYDKNDLNGDGNVDLLDSPILEGNINGFVFAVHP